MLRVSPHFGALLHRQLERPPEESKTAFDYRDEGEQADRLVNQLQENPDFQTLLAAVPDSQMIVHVTRTKLGAGNPYMIWVGPPKEKGAYSPYNVVFDGKQANEFCYRRDTITDVLRQMTAYIDTLPGIQLPEGVENYRMLVSRERQCEAEKRRRRFQVVG